MVLLQFENCFGANAQLGHQQPQSRMIPLEPGVVKKGMATMVHSKFKMAITSTSKNDISLPMTKDMWPRGYYCENITFLPSYSTVQATSFGGASISFVPPKAAIGKSIRLRS